MGDTTQAPRPSPCVKGRINLRSKVILVIDLRARFGLREGNSTGESRVTMLNVSNKTIGIIVDTVNEVLRITQDQIGPRPPTVAGLGGEYLTELVKLESQWLILSDSDKILAQHAEVPEASPAGS